MLTEAQTLRFARHVLVRELGGTGQSRLLAATVRLPRLDEDGRACALWLARAGIGRLSLPNDRSPAPAADGSGLLFAEDEGRPLVEAVSERLRTHGPDTRVVLSTIVSRDARAGVSSPADSTGEIGESDVVDLDPTGGPAPVLALIARIAGLASSRGELR